jgi:hypothetical protein
MSRWPMSVQPAFIASQVRPMSSQSDGSVVAFVGTFVVGSMELEIVLVVDAAVGDEVVKVEEAGDGIDCVVSSTFFPPAAVVGDVVMVVLLLLVASLLLPESFPTECLTPLFFNLLVVVVDSV